MSGSMLRDIAKSARNWEPTWRYLYNFMPTMSYKMGHETLDAEGARLVKALNTDGVAVTSVDRLLGGSSCFQELMAAVTKLEQERAPVIEAARRAANTPSTGPGEKSFLVNLLGDRPRLDADDVFVRFALQPQILAVANAYFGMFTKLRHYNVWHNVTTTADAFSSQLWHVDRDDLHYVMKVFVNLADVDEGCGPFTYAPGSHPKGRMPRQPAYLHKEGNTTRSNNAQMAEVVPESEWVTSAGPAGTIVLADTRGYHKGGCARTRDRLMYTCMFTSPLAQPARDQELFERPQQLRLPARRAAAFALGEARR